MRAEQGRLTLLEASATSNVCAGCIRKTRQQGCCLGWAPSSYSLAHIGALLGAGEKAFVKRLLRMPGRVEDDGLRYTLNFTRDQNCPFHSFEQGCTLEPAQRPVFCRVYLCAGASGEKAEAMREYRHDAMRLDCTHLPHHKRGEKLDTWPARLGEQVRLKRNGVRQIEAAARAILPTEVIGNTKNVRTTPTARRRDGIMRGES